MKPQALLLPRKLSQPRNVELSLALRCEASNSFTRNLGRARFERLVGYYPPCAGVGNTSSVQRVKIQDFGQFRRMERPGDLQK
jgi:hypothetical protein